MTSATQIFAFVLLSFVLTSHGGSAFCEESRKLEYDCGNYCFNVVRPLLQHVTSLKDQLDGREDQGDRLKNIERVVLAQEKKIDKVLRANEIFHALRNGFQLIGNKYYFYGQVNRTWSESSNKCKELGGHLVSLQNEKELVDISDTLNANKYWVDINDIKKAGEYISQTTGRKAPFIKWNANEPNQLADSEHCVEVKNLNSSYGLNDAACSVKNYFVCELY